MVVLPPDFVQLMHEHYDTATADTLCEALQTTDPDVSVRLNTRKLPIADLLAEHPDYEQVPWCDKAFYLPLRPAFTFDPLLHAGAYYVQEAASMYVAEVLRQFMPEGHPLVALDLCAAPGGKSTLTESLLSDESLLISNEPIAKRTQILAENMHKWKQPRHGEDMAGATCLVTQNYPVEFGGLTNSVDVLITDVPCSGEGMFRKDEGAIRDWSLDAVAMCCERQRAILQDIRHVLRPGGLLVYSTCTFNRHEDEENARWICDELDGTLLTERHFLPGRDRGEGFYVAAIRIGGEWAAQDMSSIDSHAKKARRTLRVLYDSGATPLPDGPAIELTYAEALQYLRREALRVEAPRGPVTLCYHGLVLGPGKGVGNRINNLYPEAWRIRSGYTTPFSLMPTD